MRITLISPDFYSYGAMVIGGVLHEHGHKVEIKKEFSVDADSEVVGLSFGSTLHLLDAKGFVARLKYSLHPPYIIVGGAAAQVPELVFEHLPEVDVVVAGEGDETAVELLEKIESGKKDLESVEGIAFKHDGEIVKTKGRKPFDMRKRAMPLIPSDLKYQDMRGVCTAIETHRGCIGNCSFCQAHHLFGNTIRSRPMEDILRELKLFVKKGVYKIGLGLETVTQYGWEGGLNEDAFCSLLEKACDIVGRPNLKVPDVRVDTISQRVFEAIRDYTEGYVVFGIESGSDRILKLMRKGIKVEQAYEAVEMARKSGIRRVIGSFITGYPGESEEDHEATKDLIGDLMLDEVYVNIACPIPGTLLAEKIKKLEEEENPVLKKDDTKIGRVHNLTVAERRALELYLTAIAACPRPSSMMDRKYKRIISGIKMQSNDAILFTNMIRKSSFKNHSCK
ncbi:MAG: methyl-coenzyme M reductase glutamine C-methyltransferase [Candidatus Methanospirareceae archaeon]